MFPKIIESNTDLKTLGAHKITAKEGYQVEYLMPTTKIAKSHTSNAAKSANSRNAKTANGKTARHSAA